MNGIATVGRCLDARIHLGSNSSSSQRIEENIISKRTIFAVASVIGVLTLAGCYDAPKPTYEIAMCPEPLRMSDCKVESINPYCTFENTTQRVLSGYPRAWGYSKDGAELTNFAITDLAGLQPGQKKRQPLVLGAEFKTISRVVVCSMDPMNPIVKDRIVVVGTAK